MPPKLRAGVLLLGLGVLLSALLIAPPPAQAHGYLIRVIPANRAVLERAPTRIQAWFSEGLEPRFSSLSLANERGEPVELIENGVSPTNPAQLSARIPAVLPDGVYVITMRVAFASDGHVFNERLIFWVGTQVGEVALNDAVRGAEPLEIVWRAITLPALNVLFGAALLYQLVLLSGWGNARYRAGRLAPRVMNRLTALVWVAVIAAALGTTLALIQQTAVLFATDASAALRDSLWSVVLNGTQIGDTIRFRFAMIGLAALLLFGALQAARRLPDLVAPLWASVIFASAAALFSISISSHMAGADLWQLPSIFIHWLHTLANSAWVGGLVALAVTLPAALKPLNGDERRAALLAVMRRFSVVGVVAVGLLIATGLYNSAIQIRQPSDLASTSYGLTLAAKLALITPLLLIGLYHHLAVSQGSRDRLTAILLGAVTHFPLLERLMRRARVTGSVGSVRLESVIGVLVLFAAAVLASTPPPVPPDAGRGAETPAQTVTVDGTAGDLAVRLAVDPGAAGANSYEVMLRRGTEAVNGAQVWLRFTYPALDQRSKPLRLDEAGEGVYLGAGPELGRAGDWRMLVDVKLPGEEETIRAAFRWALPDTPPVLVFRQPSLANWLGAALVIAALGAWLGPIAVRRVRALEWQRESVIIGAALGVVTAAFLIGGAVLLTITTQQVDALRNRPPRIVNPTLADSESLARGRAVYADQCAACHGQLGRGDGPRAAEFARMPVLRNLLDTRRDEDIYEAMTAGVGAMPALNLPVDERWDVINFLRSSVFFNDEGRR